MKTKNMEKKKIRLEDLDKRDPFKTPDGYFEKFTADLMSRLPERKPAEPRTINLWQRIRPWVYMAAMFVGISLTVRLFTNLRQDANSPVKDYSTTGLNLTSESDIEDYINYYEDSMAEAYFTDVLAGLSE